MTLSLPELKPDLLRYITFLFGGGLGLIINVIITYLLTEFFGLWHMVSFSIAMGLEVIFLFTYHTLVTFKKRGNLLRYLIVVLSVGGLNWLAVYFLSVILPVPYLIAIILSAGVISIANYLLNKKLVFC